MSNEDFIIKDGEKIGLMIFTRHEREE